MADPVSIHDRRWIEGLGSGVRKFLIARKIHLEGCEKAREWLHQADITFLGTIEDFSVRRPFRTLRQAIKIYRWAKRFDVVGMHVFFAEPNALWAVFKDFLGLKFVVTTRGTDALVGIPRFFLASSPLARLISWLYRFSFNRVDLLISTSQKQLESLQKLFELPKNNAVIRTGLDLKDCLSDAVQTTLPQEVSNPFIFFPRLMAPLYQHEFALEAISQLPEGLRKAYYFVFIDRDTPRQAYAKKVQSKAEAVDANLIFLPKLEYRTFRCLLKNAKLVVMTPRSDGSPVTAAEAMYLSTPVILPPLEYDREIFRRGCYFFSEWTPENLAECIERVLNSNEPNKLDLARRDVATHFDRDKEMQKLSSLYLKLLQS